MNGIIESLERVSDPAVHGFLHRPSATVKGGIVLTHGAGSNCQAPLLIALSNAFADSGYLVLRCDLPYRQMRRTGPPRPGDAARDREGLAHAVAAIRELAGACILLGGQSYGGRQCSMLIAERPELASALLLLSYPLHPPGKPEQLRVQHFPKLQVPVLFVHGTKDPFGSTEEFQTALKLIPARTSLMEVNGGGHDLGYRKKAGTELPAEIAKTFCSFMG